MRKSVVEKVLLGLAVVAILFFALFPFLWAISTSLRPGSELFSTNLLPSKATLQNYWSVLSQQSFGRNILNSLAVAGGTVFLSLGVGVMAAYALGRVRFTGRNTLLYLILGVSMFPQIAVLSGLFELLQMLHLNNSVFGLVFAYLIFTLPFTIWILTTFMQQIPRSLEEAAVMDGAKPWTIIFRIFLPLLAPSFVTTGLLAFIFAWNEFLFALTFTMTDTSRTVPVAIAFISGASQYELPWGNIMAASVIVTVPLVALVLLFQRKIVAGLTAGAVKG